LSSAVARPGADPRVWLTLATVVDLGFDPDEGLFADVKYQPSGDMETALVAAPYAGSRFGSWRPLRVDDTVLVAVPMGDPGHGPVIVARMWNAGDPPNAAFGNGQDPVEDWVDVIEPGKNYILKTSDNGTIQLQDASQSFVRGDDYADALGDYLDSVLAWIELVKTGIEAAGGTLVNAEYTTAIERLKAARNTYLSTKIKGE